MRKIREVLRLHHDLCATERELASSCNMSPSRVHEYVRRARVAGLVLPLPDDCTDEKLDERPFARQEQTAGKKLPDWKLVQRARMEMMKIIISSNKF